MSKNGFSRMAAGFTLAAVLCGQAYARDRHPPKKAMLVESAALPIRALSPSFLIATDHVPKGLAVEYPRYENLDPQYQRILDNSSISVKEKHETHTYSGKELYEKLRTDFRIELLNLMVKARTVKLEKKMDGQSATGPKTVLDHIDGIRDMTRERIFTTTDNHLAEQADSAANEKIFRRQSAADGILHRKGKGFTRVFNGKTTDEDNPGKVEKGNLQVNVTREIKDSAGKPSNREAADIDIDPKRGAGHWLDVIKNTVFHRTVSPYSVARVLGKQNLELPFRVVPIAQALRDKENMSAAMDVTSLGSFSYQQNALLPPTP